jgi:hypothetical protein
LFGAEGKACQGGQKRSTKYGVRETFERQERCSFHIRGHRLFCSAIQLQ